LSIDQSNSESNLMNKLHLCCLLVIFHTFLSYLRYDCCHFALYIEIFNILLQRNNDNRQQNAIILAIKQKTHCKNIHKCMKNRNITNKKQHDL